MKRSSLEVGINSYNSHILNLFEANIDFQFILEEYGVASYVVNYISKVESGMSKLLRDAAQDTSTDYTNSRERLKKS